MRLKLTVRSQDGERDVVVTSDATATVGDVAAALASTERAGERQRALTLSVSTAGKPETIILNPLLALHESGLGSGAGIALSEHRPPIVTASEARATVTALSGPDEGSRWHLSGGVGFIGRDESAHVRLRDAEVSRRHASVNVAGSVVVTDLNSANGMDVDSERTDRAVVTRRSRVQVGSTVLRIEPVGGSSRDASARRFSRSPRVVEPWRGAELGAPALPSVGERPQLPWVAVVAPIIAGAALFALTRNPLMLLFVALSPVLMLGMWLDQVFKRRRKKNQQSERFTAGLASLAAELAEQREAEQAARLAESPSTADVGEAIAARSSVLWTRMPEHAAFLAVRFGLGTLPSRTAVTMPSRDLGASEEWDRLRATVDDYKEVEGVPVVERMRDAGAIGVAGEEFFACEAARALLLQLTGLHSPADLAVCAFASGDATAEWEWLKWLPHTDSPHHPLTSALAGDLATSARLLSELEEIVQRRRQARGETAEVRSHLTSAAPGAPGMWDPVEREPATPAVVAFIADHAGVDRGRLVQLAQDGPDVSVYTIWLARDVRDLPVVCRTYVEVAAGRSVVAFVRHGARIVLAESERLDRSAASTLARALAPLEDDGAPVLDESDLPAAVSLVELFDDDIAGDPAAIAARWEKNDSITAAWTVGRRREPGELAAVVGQGTTDPLRIDLRRDGPHALVGGTTGSGKSEFLQTWILGMAVEYAPDRLTFLLVDYKGGSAFGDCVKLPHTVGLVTDLTPHLVRRALVSLRAELTRREELLAAKGAKDLAALEERGDQDAPPSLVIVIDEFAALASEVPEFVDGVIDVAQRGRSLGLHLVMATQRPAGVIKESIRANTNLRVALRVADEADSQDVLGIDRAAHFDPATPGRAAAKLGAGASATSRPPMSADVASRGSSLPSTSAIFPSHPAHPGPTPPPTEPAIAALATSSDSPTPSPKRRAISGWPRPAAPGWTRSRNAST